MEKRQPTSRQKVAILASGAVLLVAVLFIWRGMQPERSVAAYCKVYGQERTRLKTMSDNSYPYPSGVFDVSVTDASQIATSLAKLDRVAPKEIEPMASSLQKLYQDIHENPSHVIGNALNGGSLDDSLKAWTQKSCSN